MQYLRAAANKDGSTSSEEPPGANGFFGGALKFAGDDAAALWGSAAGFGRQLLQELNDGSEASPSPSVSLQGTHVHSEVDIVPSQVEEKKPEEVAAVPEDAEAFASVEEPAESAGLAPGIISGALGAAANEEEVDCAADPPVQESTSAAPVAVGSASEEDPASEATAVAADAGTSLVSAPAAVATSAEETAASEVPSESQGGTASSPAPAAAADAQTPAAAPTAAAVAAAAPETPVQRSPPKETAQIPSAGAVLPAPPKPTTDDQHRRVAALEAECDRLKAALQKAAAVEHRLLEENKDMEKELYQAQDRWKAQIKAAEKEAADARGSLQKSGKELQSQLDAVTADLSRADAALKESQAAERRLREENADMERELHQAQENWRSQIRKAEEEAKAAGLESQRLASEMSEQKDQFQKASASETQGQRRLEQELERSKAELDHFMQELRAAAEVEAQLRRELEHMDVAKSQLEERVGELAMQLERAQTSYSEAVQEVSTMSARLDELEFSSQSKTGFEDVLRGEVAAARERQAELEKQLNEAKWMRDYALQQVEEARAQLSRHKEEVAAQAQKQAEEEKGKPSVSIPAASNGEDDPGSNDKWQAKINQMQVEHTDELRRLSVSHREELDFLRKKNEEKDRRLEVLICERNALRLECAEHQATTGPQRGRGKDKEAAAQDLEDGLQLVSPIGSGSSSLGDAASTCVKDGDVVLRRFSRILFVSKTTRAVFYGYITILHLWLWIVLHNTAHYHAPPHT